MSFGTDVGPLGSAALVGTITVSATVTTMAAIGTIGTVMSGAVTILPSTPVVISTIGTIVSVQAVNIPASDALVVSTLAYVGTIHTITGGNVSLVAPTPVTVGSVGTVTYQTLSASATIKSVAGGLWGYELSAETQGIFGSVAATLLILNFGAASGNATIMAVMVTPPSDWNGIALHRPRPYSTLVASILGTGQYTIEYE